MRRRKFKPKKNRVSEHPKPSGPNYTSKLIHQMRVKNYKEELKKKAEKKMNKKLLEDKTVKVISDMVNKDSDDS